MNWGEVRMWIGLGLTVSALTAGESPWVWVVAQLGAFIFINELLEEIRRRDK